MTIFRCELIDTQRLTLQFVDSNDPDLIGVEVMLDGNVLIDIAMDAEAKTSVLFDKEGGQMEFDLQDFRQLLDKCEADLSAWRQRLCKAGSVWDKSL